MGTKESLRDWALTLADLGMHVFPVATGKKDPPAVRDYEHRATTDPARITRCWDHKPYNIGIACGPSNLVVVDLDMPRVDDMVPQRWSTLHPVTGADVLSELARLAGHTVPATFTVTTPSGGTHLYFRQPAGEALRNTQKVIGWKVDTRGHGGYVTAPGSLVAAGGYELIDDSDPVILPGWIHRLLAENPSTARVSPNRIAATDPGRYVSAVVADQCDRVAAAQPTHHNKELFVAACRLGEFVGGNALEHAHATAALLNAARHMISGSCQCTERRVANTIASGLRTGASNPRKLGRTA